MTKRKAFRFLLQFYAETAEQIQVGTLLTRLSSQKNNIIVTALAEYIKNHPEILEYEDELSFSDAFLTVYSRDELKEIVRQVLAEGDGGNIREDSKLHVKEAVMEPERISNTASESSGVDDMLKSLDLF